MSSSDDSLICVPAAEAVPRFGDPDLDFVDSCMGDLSVDELAAPTTRIYNISLDSAPGLPDVCIEAEGTEAIVLEFSLVQWLDPANQLQIENYFTRRARFAASAAQTVGGPAASFTFRFGSSTLTAPMSVRLVVAVDGYGIVDEAN